MEWKSKLSSLHLQTKQDGEGWCQSGCKVTGWVMSWHGVQVAEKAMQWSPYTYSPEEVKRNDPNKKRRWLIPLVLAAQIAFKVGQCLQILASCIMPVDHVSWPTKHAGWLIALTCCRQLLQFIVSRHASLCCNGCRESLQKS